MKKNAGRYHHFTQVYQKSWSYAILFLRHGTWHMQLLLFFLGYFLSFYPPNNPKNQNFKKLKKTPGDIIILHVYQKYICYIVPEICCAMDGRTDGKSDIEAPPKKYAS